MVQSSRRAPWQPCLAKALDLNQSQPHCRFFQLATVRVDGKPANRTVVFRGFFENALKFVSDVRSEKMMQLAHNPQAEACWYFTKTREQFRLSGTIKVIDSAQSPTTEQTIRLNVWQSLSVAAREQFTWPYPGEQRDPNQVFFSTPPQNTPFHHSSLAETVISDLAPPDTFSVLYLLPERVEHLILQGCPQNRYLYVRHDDQWKVSEINP